MKDNLNQLSAWLSYQPADFFLCTDPKNVRWLTGFSGSFAWVLMGEKVMHFITDGRYAAEGKAICSALNMHLVLLRAGAEKWPNCADKATMLIEDTVQIGARQRLQKRFENYLIQPVLSPVLQFRRVKNEAEMETMQAAQSHVDTVLNSFLQKEAYSGVTEIELAWRLEMALRDEGKYGLSFDPIVAFGANSAQAHHRPTKAKLAVGQPMLIDCGVTKNGYASDMTRMYCLQQVPNGFQADFDAVLQAQEKGIKMVKAGVKVATISKAVRADLGDREPLFSHSLGHGVGLNIHEAPSLSIRSEEVLQAREVITLEPGIYREGKWGIRIEDIVRVTPHECVVMSQTPKSLRVLGV